VDEGAALLVPLPLLLGWDEEGEELVGLDDTGVVTLLPAGVDEPGVDVPGTVVKVKLVPRLDPPEEIGTEVTTEPVDAGGVELPAGVVTLPPRQVVLSDARTEKGAEYWGLPAASLIWRVM